MERWTSSSAEEGMAAEATPENGEGAGEERPIWMGSLTKKKMLINLTQTSVLGV